MIPFDAIIQNIIWSKQVLFKGEKIKIIICKQERQ